MSSEEALPELVARLRSRKEEFALGGEPKERERQRLAGKLTARERLALLFRPWHFYGNRAVG